MTDIKCMPIVIVRTMPNGDVEYFVSGDPVQLLLVDERAPGDRVYEWLPRHPFDPLTELIGQSVIGSSLDMRHEAIKRQVENYLDGTPVVTLVPGDSSDD